MQNGDEASSINSKAYMQGWSDTTSLAGWSAAPYGDGGGGGIYKGGFHLLISPDCLILHIRIVVVFQESSP